MTSNRDDNYKTNVPINATLIGSIATIVVTLSVIFRSLFSESTTIVVLFSLVAGMFQIPLVLAFTIKHHNKTSNINPVVPKTLQFHEDEHYCENISNRANDATIKNYGNLIIVTDVGFFFLGAELQSENCKKLVHIAVSAPPLPGPRPASRHM